MRRWSPIELAVAASLVGSLAAVAIPAFVRNVHRSRFAEPTEALARMSAGAVSFAETRQRFPDSAPLTPATPPRGTKEVAPAGSWESPAWRALDFRPAPDGVPHAYAYAFDAQPAAFVTRARGDLDGDGVLSLFELRGSLRPDGPRVEPGIYVEAELE